MAIKMLHDIGFIHADIRQENILITPEYHLATDESVFIDNGKPQLRPVRVKIIDLAQSAKKNAWGLYLATTPYYRAPEITIGAKWGYEIDSWSLGVLLIEMYLGNVPFYDKNQDIFIASIQHMVGLIPQRLLDECTNHNLADYFVNGIFDTSMLPTEKRNRVISLPPLHELLSNEPELQDLAMLLLNPDPMKRISMTQTLQHPFLSL